MSSIVHSKTEKPNSSLFSVKSEQIVQWIVYEPERKQIFGPSGQDTTSF